MKKRNINSIILSCIGVIALFAICYGIFVFVQHVNGTSPAQIEARQRANEAADQSSKALEEAGQWTQEPVTVTNSDGEEVTYGTQAAPCINSYN